MQICPVGTTCLLGKTNKIIYASLEATLFYIAYQ